MAQINPVASPVNSIVTENNYQLIEVTKNKAPAFNVQDTTVPQGLASPGATQNTRPLSTVLVAHGNIHNSSHLRTSTSTDYGNRNEANTQVLHSVPDFAHTPESMPNTSLLVSNHSQQTRPPQTCPSKHVAIPQGAIGPSTLVSSTIHASHGVSPPLQTTPYYFNVEDHTQQTKPSLFFSGVQGCSLMPIDVHQGAQGLSTIVSHSPHASYAISEKEQGTNQPHAASTHAHVREPMTSMPSHVRDNTQQTKAPFFNTCQQSCLPNPPNVFQGAHGARIHENSAIHAPHAVFPPQQTASYYYNTDSILCPPQHMPFSSFLSLSPPQPTTLPTSLSLPPINALSQPSFFNPSSHDGPPLPHTVQHLMLGNRLPEYSALHAQQGLFPAHAPNHHYYNVNNSLAHSLAIPRTQFPRNDLFSILAPHAQAVQDGFLDSQRTHAHGQSTLSVPYVACPPSLSVDQPLLQTVQPINPSSNESEPAPLLGSRSSEYSSSLNVRGPALTNSNPDPYPATYIGLPVDQDKGHNIISEAVIPSIGASTTHPKVAFPTSLHTAGLPSQTHLGGIGPQSENPPPSYAHIVCPPTQPSDVLIPSKKGDYLVVSIDDNLYRSQVEKCKQSFIGKISYTIGDKPHPFLTLKNRLKAIWNTKGGLRIVPLGKGYFNISFDSSEDRKSAGARSRWSISPGVIRLSPRSPL